MRLAAFALLLAAGPAFAHKLNVEVSPRTDPRRLAVRAYYDGDDPADGATAVLRDAAGTQLGRAILDANGVGELPWPAGEWVLTVDDGAGHRTRVRSDRTATPPSNRWLMVSAGLVLIGGWTLWRRMRARG